MNYEHRLMLDCLGLHYNEININPACLIDRIVVLE